MSSSQTSDYSTPGYIVQASLLGAVRKGLDPRELLQKSGINPHILDNPSDRIESSLFANLIRHIWLDMQDEFLGFGAQRSKLGTFATMCQSILPCHNLNHALKRGARFYGLFENTPSLSVVQLTDQQTLIELDTSSLDDPDDFLTLCIMVLIHRFSSWLVGQRIVLIRAQFNHPAPDRAENYGEFLTCEVKFGAQTTGFVIANKILQAPLIQSETALTQFLMTSPLDLVTRPIDLASYSGKVRRLIGRDFSSATPGLDEVAVELHVSSQTLRRRLKDEGTSFQDIKDKLRRDLAVHYLNSSDISVEELADKLGFSEPSNFHRAFKKWTGSTPRKYRLV